MPAIKKNTTLIRDAQIVTMNPNREIIHGDVLIKDDFIIAIGDIEGDTETVIDACGMTLTPGFIQTHVHLCQTLFRNAADDLSLLDWLHQKILPLEAAHSPSSIRVSAKLGLAELLRGGTTTILDMGTVHHTDVIFEEIELAGIRAISGKCMMDKCIGNLSSLSESPKASLDESERLAKNWHGRDNQRIQYALCPRFSLSCSEMLLRQVSEIAHDKNLRVHSHAAENKEEIDLIIKETGLRNITYLHTLGLLGEQLYLAHCIWLDDSELSLVADSGTNVLHCPNANLKLGSGIAKIPEMLAKEISVSLGADGAACNNNLDILQEMRLAALLQKLRLGPKAITSQQVFEMATIKGAQALHLDQEIGSLETGKKADMVLIDTNQPHNLPGDNIYAKLVYSAKSADVRMVMVNGRILFRNNQLLTLDQEAVIHNARKEWDNIRKRADI